MVVATLILVGSMGFTWAGVQPSPGHRLLDYLWNYQHWQLRPYVSAVSLSGGHVVVASGRARLTGATANIHATLRDQPSSSGASRHICQVAAAGARKLHLSMVSIVHVWSVDGRVVARC